MEAAYAFGYAAFHVAHRGWSSLKDPQVLRRVLDEELTLVTNNWIDFRPMLERLEVHPGIVVILPNVRRERQIELFTAALTAIQEHDPPLDMIKHRTRGGGERPNRDVPAAGDVKMRWMRQSWAT